MSIILPADDPNSAFVAAEMLSHGKLVVIPTDTGYGLAAPMADEAILRLYLAKETPPARTIPVLIGTLDDLAMVAQPLMPPVRRLVEKFWPGPLTLLLPKANGLPQRISALPTVAVRFPEHDGAISVIQAAGGAIAVSKASIADQEPPQTSEKVVEMFGDKIAAVVDGGTMPNTKPSTVAEIEGRTITVVRPGPISEDELKAALEQ